MEGPDIERFILDCDDPDQSVPVSAVKKLLVEKGEQLQVAAGKMVFNVMKLKSEKQKCLT